VVEPLPLPDDPTLAAAAQALDDAGFVAEVWDREARLAYVTREFMLSAGGGASPPADIAIGEHILSTATLDARLSWPGGPTLEAFRESFPKWGGFLLDPGPEARASLLAVADPRLRDMVERLSPTPMPSAWPDRTEVRLGNALFAMDAVRVRLLDEAGVLAGVALVAKPAIRGTVLSMLALGDTRLFDRIFELTSARRRPAAILFADLEGSTALSRRLGAAEYFALLRRFARDGDDVIVSAGGVVGKHAGDGVTAFFLGEGPAGEADAAAAAIRAARSIRDAMPAIARRSEIEPSELLVRFGLHWGATVHVGRLLTAGRIEVTAIGDEVNEAARIEACATGGRLLASKALVARLRDEDAHALGLDLARMRYTALSELPTATEKARRDAPAIPVCEV
jgi:class 3 adenylate cyclase